MKIPIQRKIAELESRISTLETRLNAHLSKAISSFPGPYLYEPPKFSEHWRKMWDEFELAVKELLGKQ